MSTLAITNSVLPATPLAVIEQVVALEDRIRQCEQIDICTEHVFHAGLYARTVRLTKGMVIVSALVKIPTLIIVNGVCDLMTGDRWVRLEGFNVLPANAGRKLVYQAVTDLEITMLFKTNATTVEQAEAEFTNEHSALLSRAHDNNVIITGVE